MDLNGKVKKGWAVFAREPKGPKYDNTQLKNHLFSSKY